MNERIKILRSELGLSIRSFAEELNLTAGTISLIENGKRNLTDRTISDICRLYHVSEDWLRNGNGEMFQERTKETEIAEITARMFKAEDADLRYNLMKLLNIVSDEELEALFNAAKKWVDSVESNDEKYTAAD